MPSERTRSSRAPSFLKALGLLLLLALDVLSVLVEAFSA